LGEAWLFFGCRNKNLDFLYEDEIQEFIADGTLTQNYAAFSREGEGGCYIQDRVLEQHELVLNAMEKQDGRIYACGDVKGVVAGVRKTLLQMMEDHGGKSRGEAANTLQGWMKNGR